MKAYGSVLLQVHRMESRDVGDLIMWLVSSYLLSKNRVVHVNGFIPEHGLKTSSVIQGGVQGNLLFLL